MKKIISLLVLVFAMVTMLTACGKFTCALCNEEKSGEKHVSEIEGEKIEICDDCYELLNEGFGG